MKHIVAVSVLSLILVACGGGGGSGGGGGEAPTTGTNRSTIPSDPSVVTTVTTNTPVLTNCITKPALAAGTYRVAPVDMRFDQPNDFNSLGQLVAGYDNVSTVINKINCVGYDTIVFMTNIPIDTATGNLVLYNPDPTHFIRNKAVPQDLWRLVTYAKGLGLRVFIKAIPVNYVNDDIICPACSNNKNVTLTPTFVANFFNTLTTYGRQLAQSAQSVGADGFYVASFNMGLDTSTYNAQWDTVVSTYRSVFSGKLLYDACYQCTNVVWNKVDIVDLNTNFPNTTTATTLQQLVVDYSKTDIVAKVQANAATYKKPIILSGLSVNAAEMVVDPWDVLMAGGSTGTATPNYPLQSMKLSAELELIAIKLNSVVSGEVIGNYNPWTNATWIENGTYNVQWHTWLSLGNDTYHNQPYQTTISSYLKYPIGYHAVPSF
jgi:hypothetical protein